MLLDLGLGSEPRSETTRSARGIAPGKIDTELVAPIVAWTEKREMPVNPMRRIGTASEAAELVAFLVSDHAGYLTGVTVPIDGGELLTAGAESGR